MAIEIPKSSAIQRPQFQTTQPTPNFEQNQIIPKAIGQLGNDVMNASLQLEYAKIKEEQNYNASQLLDFKTNLSKFENQQRIKLAELPSNDPEIINTAKESFLKERQSFIESFSKKYNDKTVKDLIKREADVRSVDFEFDTDRTLLTKKREYGTNKIYEGIYSIQQSLERGGNVAKAKQNLDEILQVGLKAGYIDQKDIIREKERQADIVKKMQEEYKKNRLADIVASGQMMLNPNESDDKKIGELAFDRIIARNPKANIDQLAQSFAIKTGYVPDRVKQIWGSYLVAGNSEQKIKASSQIVELINQNPRLQGQFNSEDISFVNAVKNRLDTGLSPDQIINNANNDISKIQSLDKQQKKILFSNKDFAKDRDKAFKSLTKELSDEEGFDLFKGSVEIPDQMKAGFNQLVEDHLMNNQNSTKESAVEYAKEQIKSQWAVTNIGKRRLMRYAPESFYRGAGSDWIKGQLKDTISKHELVESYKKLDDNYNIIPKYDSIINGQPSYYISKIDKYGMQDYVRDKNNQPVIFQPDFQKSKAFKDIKEEMAKKFGKNVGKQDIIKAIEKGEFNRNLDEAISFGAKNKFGGGIE